MSNNTKTINIATRKSALALWQANAIKQALLRLDPSLTIELIGMTTQGDKTLDISLAKIGGKGLFVKELEQALYDKRADIAVHSMKDVPTELPEGLTIAAICERADPRDAFVSVNYERFQNLPAKSCVGTSSLRRQSQLQAMRSDLVYKDLRGNVNTRLKKLEQGEYDAIILAAAGLQRLDLADWIKDYFSVTDVLPAAAQGALGIECREDDADMIALLQQLEHAPTRQCVSAERALTRRLNGSCQVPIASYAVVEQEQLILNACVGKPDGSKLVNASASGVMTEPDILGQQVATELLANGADNILQALGVYSGDG